MIQQLAILIMLAILMMRLRLMIRWVIRSPTLKAFTLRLLVGYLIGTMAHHLWLDVTTGVPQLVAHFRSTVAPVEPTPQIVCPSADPTPPPDHLSIHLQDHTTVEVNSDACLTVVFTATLRRIKLDFGEAIFQVAPDPRRPFVVETGPIAVQALGTQFDVYRKKDNTRVAVIEGAVQISSQDGMSRQNVKPLTILQQIVVPDDIAQSRVRSVITSSDFDRITAWRFGDIQLQNQPLKEALEEFARYQHLQVNFADPQIGEVRFSGVFHTTSFDDFASLLKLKCIQSDYDRESGRIEFTTVPGKRAGNACK